MKKNADMIITNSNPGLRWLAIPSLILSCLLASFSTQAEVYYKWQDENGNWMYGATAPVGIDAIRVKTHSGTNERKAGPGAEENTNEGTETDNASLASNGVDKDMCNRAKQNLDALNSGAVIQRLDENGQSVTLNPAEMQAERDKAKAAIKQFCLGF